MQPIAWCTNVMTSGRYSDAVGCREYIEADVADTHLAELLLIEPGAAVLIARRCSRAADRRPIEYVVNTYRADRYRFRVELVRP